MRRIFGVAAAALALVASACGDGASDGGGGTTFTPAEGGEVRNVLVDYRHDEFASAFFRYYPETVKVRPGDVVKFRQSWTGEPHSVTMGKVVDNLFEFGEIFEKYDSPEAALAGGVTQETIDTVNATFAKLPGMLSDDYVVYQPGAQPCFIASFDDVPDYSDGDGGEDVNENAECPTAGGAQPEFDGSQGLYNSGFIAPEGGRANTFELPIAEDAEPGTYKYFCNYHWIDMSGTVEIVESGADIPSQQEVSRQARKEIDADAELALEKRKNVTNAKGGKVDDRSLPFAGLDLDDDFTVVVNEFLPKKIKAEVGEPVSWTFLGIDHTVSFNVPKYFPVLSIEDDGTVTWNPKSFEPVGWDLDDLSGGDEAEEAAPEAEATPPEEQGVPEGEEEDEGDVYDVGEWDGKGGFHSSGALDPNDVFTVTFTKAGTYPYACVLHPQMVGTVEVR